MSARESQVTASISEATKERLDRFTENRGLKKNFVVEQALLSYLEAHTDLPDEAFIPARIVVDDATFARVVALIEDPPPARDALRELMGG